MVTGFNSDNRKKNRTPANRLNPEYSSIKDSARYPNLPFLIDFLSRTTVVMLVSLFCLSCHLKSKSLSTYESIELLNPVKYSWSGGAAGLSGMNYEVELKFENARLMELWVDGRKLKWNKVHSAENFKWRAGYSTIEGIDDELPVNIEFPINYHGEAVTSYQLKNEPFQYIGIEHFVKKPSIINP